MNVTQKIKQEAKRLGFFYCGVSKAGYLEKEAPLLEKWLQRNMHGEMSYMANHFDMRLNPEILVPGAKSVVSLAMNYYPKEEQSADTEYRISRYAYGADYHKVIRKKLKKLLHFIREDIGEVQGRGFVDSAPVMDKVWAAKSGMGWMGKHTNLISKQNGSYFFIANLIIDIKLEYDEPVADHCGSCTRCIDACPTDAIVSPYIVDGSKCISYFTIELKKQIPEQVHGKMNEWIFGCDICQEVCPWNRFSKATTEEAFGILPSIKSFTKREWEEITEEIFEENFKNSPLKRTGFTGLKRNIKAASGKE